MQRTKRKAQPANSASQRNQNNAQPINNIKTLINALMKHDCGQVDALLQGSVDVNCVDAIGRCPLGVAVDSACVRCLERLIQRGAIVDMSTSNSFSALYAAAVNGQMNAVQCLLRHNAGDKITDSNGMQPLHWACKHGHGDIVHHILRKFPKTVDITTTDRLH